MAMMSLRAASNLAAGSAPAARSLRSRIPSTRRAVFTTVKTSALQTASETSKSRTSSSVGDVPAPPPPTPDHAQHRDAVLSQLPEGKLVFVPAGKQMTRNGVEGNARFRQEPDFLYLTGVVDPGYAALFGTGADAPFVLVAPRQAEEMDVWCGAQAIPDELRRATGADIVYYDDEWVGGWMPLFTRVFLVCFCRQNTVQL